METELLAARINDTAEIAERTQKPKFLGFLSPEQAALAGKILKNRHSDFELFGGYDGAGRVMLGCFPEWDNEHSFPVSAVTFRYRDCENLAHRDFLGSLMAAGIVRETVGDILVEKGRTVVFLNSEIKNYVMTQIDKIGRTGVKISEDFTLPLPAGDKLSDFSDTVASLRLDCVVAALGGMSRSSAAQMITDGYVSVNSVICDKPVKTVAAGDVLSIRTKGKFIIADAYGRTKKDRIVLKYQKYL